MYNTDKTYTQLFKRNGLILHAINQTGFSGNTYFKPLQVRNSTFTLQTDFKPKTVKSMVGNKFIQFNYQKVLLHFNLD